MAGNYKREGDSVRVVLTSGQTGVAVGEGYKIGSQVGVVLSLTRSGQTVFNNVASAEGDVAVVALEGVFAVAKASGALTLGQKLYWDNTAGNVTGTGSGNTFMGFADVAAASDATTVDIRLVQSDASGAAVAAVVAAVTTANGSDASTTQALANQLKTSLNEVIAALKAAGLMATS